MCSVPAGLHLISSKTTFCKTFDYCYFCAKDNFVFFSNHNNKLSMITVFQTCNGYLRLVKLFCTSELNIFGLLLILWVIIRLYLHGKIWHYMNFCVLLITKEWRLYKACYYCDFCCRTFEKPFTLTEHLHSSFLMMPSGSETFYSCVLEDGIISMLILYLV